MKKTSILSSTFQKSNLLTWVDISGKKVLNLIINFYQNFISVIIKNILGIDKMCRFSPTCSEYAKTTINKEGVLVGIRKSASRILRCQPFFSVS